MLRRVTRINDDISTVDPSTQILVSDTGNDQTLLTSVWTILERTGGEVTMTGAGICRTERRRNLSRSFGGG